jgi:general secretion pathway protein M
MNRLQALKLPERWKERWDVLAPRERAMATAAAAFIALALLWWIALAPAMRTISAAREEHAKLDAQLLQMTTLQAQAKALQAQPRTNRDDAVRALEESVRQGLGPNAQLQSAGVGEGANLSVRGVSADALAQWLAQARGNAHAVPREVHLTRSQATTPAAASRDGAPREAAKEDASPKVRWDGTLVMSLPAAR